MERTQIEFWDGIYFDEELDRTEEKKTHTKIFKNLTRKYLFASKERCVKINRSQMRKL